MLSEGQRERSVIRETLQVYSIAGEYSGRKSSLSTRSDRLIKDSVVRAM